MAKNDTVLLDGIIDQRLAESLPSKLRDEVFEFLVLEEVLKDYDPSHEELDLGWIDGNGDGGIDGFYVFINGRLLDDLDDFSWPRSNASIEVWLVTCKHHETFLQATLDALLATLQELFDFSIDNNDLSGAYSDELIAARTLLHQAYRHLSIGRPILNFKIVYASRGDTTKLGASVAARAVQIETTVADLFSSSTATVRFLGAAELVELHRRSRRFTLELPFVEHLATGKQSYVLLVRLLDYWRFVTDDAGVLRRYLFDSNVRDFLGENPVNQEIARSLEDQSSPDFWWLNNGITILATSATIPGKTIQMQDIQIVNGLQTTETIYGHFQSGSLTSKDGSLLVKIIVTTDARDRDRIIRATNNQSPVDPAALHATDKIQRDIEEILARDGWYYERRRNYYRNIGKPSDRFVTPIYLASAVVALILKNPVQATRLRSRFMRTQIGYDAVFSTALPIQTWAILTGICKGVDAELMKLPTDDRRGEKFVSTWRALVALIAVAARLKTFSFSVADLAQFAGSPLLTSEIAAVWSAAAKFSHNITSGRKLKQHFVQQCCDEAAVALGILDSNVVCRRHIPSALLAAYPLPDAFVAQVDGVLPEQPWNLGVHFDIASKLNCKASRVSQAIRQLINAGRRKRQRNGIVYASDGSVFAVDSIRVPQSVEELNASGHRWSYDQD